MITIARAELTAEVSRALIRALNDELSGMYSEPGATHFRLDPEEVTGGRGTFLIVYREGTPVGCGALRLLDAETAEIKRMYVIPAARGTGLGRRLVAALEKEALALGVRRLVLETGVRQQAALVLYRATGFLPIPLYGEYCLSPETSVCLGKELPPNDLIRIERLADHPEALPVLKTWFEEQWPFWYGPGRRGDAEKDLRAYSSLDGLPMGLVAFRGDELCGIAALKAESITSHAHLRPWAAAGLVPASSRNQGIGSALLNALEDVARRLRYANIYCGTSTAEGLLRRAGWRFIEKAL